MEGRIAIIIFFAKNKFILIKTIPYARIIVNFDE